jgi:nicotinamide phosphoribosyltransferase
MPQPFRPNPLRLSDSYKDTHFYDALVAELLSYYEARGGEFPYTQLFGLQYKLMAHFEGQFFTQRDLDEQFENSQQHFYPGFPYNKEGWQYILDRYDGRLPVEIKAVEEGRPVPVHNVMWTCKSTDSKVVFIEQWMETVLQQVSIASAVCTKSRMVKELIRDFLAKSADTYASLNFQLHDFGFRGVGGVEEAALSGAAHLVNFMGTDTQVAMDLLHQYYGAPRVSAYSVPATEHSMMTLRGRAGEADQVEAALAKYPTGILSIVGDSYDIYNFCQNIIGGRFREQIRNRDGKVVVRPDSGDYRIVVPKCLEILGDKFGYSENSKGFKVLAPVVGMIQGDGMDYFGIKDLFNAMLSEYWSAENTVVGMGGGLLRKVNRDTQKVAVKLCNAVIDGKNVPVWKDPITDPGKTSKRGRMGLLYDKTNNRYTTVEDTYNNGVPFDILQTVFRNGEMKRIMTLDQIRKWAEVPLPALVTA